MMYRTGYALLALLFLTGGCTALFEDLDDITWHQQPDAGGLDADDPDADDPDADGPDTDGPDTDDPDADTEHCSGCLVEGDCIDDGAEHPENSCEVCVGEDQWSSADDGLSCGADATCQSGECVCDDGLTGRDCDICTVFVNQSAPPDQEGLSWATAFSDLQQGLQSARDRVAEDDEFDFCEVWVASGTYLPDSSDRDVSFELTPNLHIYGGFNGTESGKGLRDWTANQTVLSGNDTSYTVVNAPRGHNGIFSGFHIQRGRADEDDNQTSQGRSGGGLYVESGTTTFSDLLIQDNFAHRSGGGLHFQPTGNSDIEFINVEFLNNTADLSGGAISLNGNSDYVISMTFRDVRFDANSAPAGGAGVIDFRDNELLLESFVFTDNIATDGNGGALSVVATDNLMIRDGTFENNSAELEGEPGELIRGRGGAIYTRDADLEIDEVQFIENSAAKQGGAIHISAEWLDFSSDMRVRNGRFEKNSATLGGAVHILNSDARFINTLFHDNEARTGGGGGIYSQTEDDPAYPPSQLILINSTLMNNQSNDSGDGIKADRNWEAINTIIWGDTLEQVRGEGVPTFTQCIVREGPQGSINQSPDLFNTTYKPRNADSPAVDDGVNRVLDDFPFPTDEDDEPIDLAGEPRLVGDFMDIGAFEFQP